MIAAIAEAAKKAATSAAGRSGQRTRSRSTTGGGGGGGGGDLLSTNNLSDVASAATARTNLGLAIGTNVQAWDAQLDSLSSASANGVSLVVAADYAAMKALLDLEIGTDVQAYNARLADVAGASWAQGDVMYHNGSNLVRLPAGTSGYFLKTLGAGANPEWAASSGAVATDAIWDAKGDLAVGTGANTASVLGVGSNGQVLSADSGEATGLKWITVAGTGDVTAASSFGTDNVVIRADGTGKGVQSSLVSISDNADITAYDATNDGNPVIAYGASATERLRIVPTYDTGAQTIDYVLFTTDVASATADKGLFRFSPDGSAVLDIDDGGINLAASMGISIAGTDILTDAAGTATLSNIDALDATTEATIEAAIDTLANLASIQGVAFTFGAYAATLLNNANEAAFKAAVNLEAGTDFYSVSAANAAFQPLDGDLTSWAGVTRAAGFDTFAATATSANLASLVSDETGTGALVFANTPTLVTPVLGAATGTSIALSSFGVFGHTAALASPTGSGASVTPDLQVQGIGGNTSASLTRWTNDTAGPRLIIGKARGTSIASYTVVASGDVLAEIVGAGADGTDLEPAAAIRIEVDGTPGAGDMPGRIVFATTADGAEAVTDRLILDSAGVLKPNANDGVALGTTALSFADAFFASGAVINFNNGDVTITHSANALAIAGGVTALDASSTVGGSVIKTVGKETIFIPAAAMTARTTNGAASGTTELTTNDVMLASLDFDQTTEEGAGFFILMPKSWNESTVTFRPVWTAASGSGGVVWGLAAYAFSDDDAMDTAVSGQQTSTDTLITANDCHLGPESSAITIGGTPAEMDYVYFEITREVANGSDTLSADAKLLGIHIYMTSNASTDA